ncbi:hypothetical protein T10_5668 [Trichinella papuae]|uniref:Uncharacterized protein n=1 Tax=Trichinella papuae TaxID=268474 RepID=A0A0V1MXI2_9BILA|nr:hypothetical protein T10_5668 [Trichinella papuae]
MKNGGHWRKKCPRHTSRSVDLNASMLFFESTILSMDAHLVYGNVCAPNKFKQKNPWNTRYQYEDKTVYADEA